MPHQQPDRVFKAKLFGARLAGLFEGVWPALWPAIPAVLAFTALGLMGLWPAAPLWLHVPALIALAALCGYALVQVFQRFHWPTREEGLTRLERDNDLAHQPLRKTVEPQPVHGDATSAALWQAHLDRLAAQTATVTPAPPKLSWMERDPFALTSAAFLALAIGLFVASDQRAERLFLSFVPNFGGAPAQVDVEIRAVPPRYTGIAPILLTAFDAATQQSGASMTLPAGTLLEMRLTGGWRTPRAQLDGVDAPFKEVGKNRYNLTLTAPQSETLAIRQGQRLQYEWQGRFTADAPPEIAMSGLPERSTSEALFFNYEISDDYGIARASLFVRPQDDPAQPMRLEIPTPKIAPGERETRRFAKDLTASRWAGRPVTVQLEAWDGLDQKGQSAPLEMVLPERVFEHPLAREVIQQRKRLFFENGSRLGVAQWLNTASTAPARFDESLWVFSMLRSAHYRLTRHDSQEVVDGVTEQLWEVATYLEDGGLSQGRDAMREAMEQMMQALESSDAQAFDALSRQLEAKIADLMRKQMQRLKGQEMPQGVEGGELRMIDSSTLERMMQQMRDLAAAGDMAGAMQMLEAIQSLMENLNSSPGPSQEMLEQAQAAQDALEDLNALMEDQRSLMNQTVRQALEGAQQGEGSPQQGEQRGQQQGGDQPGGQQSGSGRYQALEGSQRGLEGAGRSLGQRLSDAGVPVPSGLENANGAMGQAAQRLGQERGLPALRSQADALRNLEAAQEALEGQVEQMMQQIRAQSSGRDPFGRPDGRSLSNGLVKIPTEAEAKKAREIRDELQRRLGDPNRTILERSYFRRLLEQFSR